MEQAKVQRRSITIDVWPTSGQVSLRDRGMFQETKHPRGQPENKGEFAKAATTAATAVKHAAKHYGREDYDVITKHLKQHSHNPKHVVPQRKHLADHLMTTAKVLPKLLHTHLKEEQQNAVHAVGAVRALSSGNRPTPEQFKGLRAFGMRVLMTSASMAVGDPTGGGAAHIAVQIGHEALHHVAMEHAMKAVAGWGRVVAKKFQKDDMSSADMALLQRFVETFAEAVRNVTDEEIQAYMAQRGKE